eukprot:1799712-Karenia_brevis.AAC.1
MLKPAPLVEPIKRLYKKKVTAAWTMQHKATLMAVVAGAYPDRVTLHEEGVVDNSLCEYCHEATGTLHHLRWM